MAVDNLNSTGTSQWHAVRPWTPRFVLTVREVTSVSATFILSSDLSTSADPPLASLGLAQADDDDSFEDVPLVSDALGRGLSVNVNGATWKRVLVRMDDEGDEAIIILYGLMPGRQYDIELGIVSMEGEEVLHSRMVTQAQVQAPAEISSDHSISSISDSDYATTSPLPSRSISHDEYAAQLRLKLSALNAERDALQSQVKSARKDSQKADATLRGEIEALRRAAEKNSTAEQRARQKVLALQEAVKQALAATKESETLAEEIEASLPTLREREREAGELHGQAVKDEESSKAEANEAIRADKKRTGDLQTELTSLTNRLERLTGKRDKLLSESVPELEEQLAKLIREVELVERDAGAFEVIDNGPVGFDLGSRAVGTKFSKFSEPYGLSPSAESYAASGSLLSSRAIPFEPGRAAQSQNLLSSLRTPPTLVFPSTTPIPQSSSSSSSSSPTPTSNQTLDGSSAFEVPHLSYLAASSAHIHQHSSQTSRSRSRHAPRSIAPGPPGIIQFGHQSAASSYLFDPPQQHSHSQSVDYAQPIGNALSSSTRLGLRALSPARQASLPTRMPSSYAAVSANSSTDQIL